MPRSNPKPPPNFPKALLQIIGEELEQNSSTKELYNLIHTNTGVWDFAEYTAFLQQHPEPIFNNFQIPKPALYWAIEKNCEPMIRYMLPKIYNIDYREFNPLNGLKYRTAIHWAAAYANVDIVRLLLTMKRSNFERGEDGSPKIWDSLQCEDAQHNTPLDLVIERRGNIDDLVRAFIENGVNLDTVTMTKIYNRSDSAAVMTLFDYVPRSNIRKVHFA